MVPMRWPAPRAHEEHRPAAADGARASLLMRVHATLASWSDPAPDLVVRDGLEPVHTAGIAPYPDDKFYRASEHVISVMTAVMVLALQRPDRSRRTVCHEE